MPRPTNTYSGHGRRSARIARGPAWLYDELAFAWRTAQDDATAAYDAWSARPAADTYAAYRAAQDRADAAQETLAAQRSR
jgi:hypothetical protein